MANETSREWVAWGETDPFLAVMGYLPDGRPWSTEAFYGSAEPEWESSFARWSVFGVDTSRPVVDLGCGPGRFTRCLAQAFPEVIGIDVSAAQLELARQAVADLPASCSFHVSQGPVLPLPAATAGAVFSMSVFQHLDRSTAESLIREIGRVLEPGGTVMLHIPVPGSNLSTTVPRVLLRSAVEPVRFGARRLAHRVGGLPPVRMRVYDTVRVFRLMGGAGIGDLEMCLCRLEPGGMYFSFFLGRKPAQPGPCR